MVDCVKHCQEVFETDIDGAKEFGIVVKVESLNSPPISRVEISELNSFVCRIGRLNLSVGEATSEVGPEVVSSYSSISSLMELRLKIVLWPEQG
ncbi:MAG: hypothetical protein ACI87Q_000859 [Pseudohongiellaceae bacterium]